MKERGRDIGLREREKLLEVILTEIDPTEIEWIGTGEDLVAGIGTGWIEIREESLEGNIFNISCIWYLQ